jgi:NAD(P)-dependent dehydrogenase (short-subunit alcohol dehydrogenase family)
LSREATAPSAARPANQRASVSRKQKADRVQYGHRVNGPRDASTEAQVPTSEFQGSVVIVTGGASGIGLETASLFASLGAHVVVGDLNQAALEAVHTRIAGGVSTVHADVSSPAGCERVVQAAATTQLPLRALVNCAASFLGRGADATAADWDTVLAVNVRGPALMASAALPLLRAAQGAAIVNLASVSGHIAQPNSWTYNTTKGAILALTRCQALDLAPDRIRVNSVSPGTIRTPALEPWIALDPENALTTMGDQHILRRVGDPTEIASVIAFLCGRGASFMTGADVVVDGGYLARGHDALRGEPARDGAGDGS